MLAAQSVALQNFVDVAKDPLRIPTMPPTYSEMIAPTIPR